MTEGGIARLVRHPLSPFKKRAFFSIAILGLVMAIGTIGMMILEGWDLVTSFYFMSLLATAEGPAQSPMTVGGGSSRLSWPFSLSARQYLGLRLPSDLCLALYSKRASPMSREEDKLKTRLERKAHAHSSADQEG